MHAVILVGGRGTRLRPLTDTVPKPMLPIGNMPMIKCLVERIAGHGVTQVTLALGFRPEPFADAFPDARCGEVQIHYAVEPRPLDTAGAIAFAARFSGIDERFIVINGDVICELDLSALVATHDRSHETLGAEVTLHLTPVEDPSAFGVVEIADNGQVRRFLEKPPAGMTDSNLISGGTYVCEPDLIERIPEDTVISVEREIFPDLVEQGKLFAVATEDYWLDTGRPDLYLQANTDLLAGRRTQPFVAVASGAMVADSALVSASMIADDVVVGDRAVIRDSVLLAGARIGDGAVIERSIVMGEVGEAAMLVECVVGADGHVPAHSELVSARCPEPQ
jgi:mannose-1-phosphate guanylyltransferase